MHLVSMTVGVSSSVDPYSCLFWAMTQESAHIERRTGLFANAAGSFTGSVSANGVLPRNPDGSCDVGRPAPHEVDKVEFSGTLSL